MNLILNHLIFGVHLIRRQGVKHIKFVRGTHHAHLFSTAKMINGNVMRNPKNPRQELAFFIVLATFQCIHNLNKGVLEQIVCQIGVPNDEENFRINLLLMAVQKEFERCLIPREVEGDQLLVRE